MAGDPTQTTVLRQTFVNDFKRRFKKIKSLSVQSVSENDCFGLKKYPLAAKYATGDQWKDFMRPIPVNEYKFNTNSQKIKDFMEWLHEMEKKSVFQVIASEPERLEGEQNWTNLYISRAYKHGMLRASSRLKANKPLRDSIGINETDVSTEMEDINRMFNTPIHADRVGLLYTRTFTDLEGITAAMDTQISRVLAQGLALGQHPLIMAKNLAERVEKIGITRATILARTEVVRAQHLAAMQVYRDFGVSGIKVKAEWVTFGDSRVCPLCAPLNGKVFTIDEIEGMIPVHPQCRCDGVPVVIE